MFMVKKFQVNSFWLKALSFKLDYKYDVILNLFNYVASSISGSMRS